MKNESTGKTLDKIKDLEKELLQTYINFFNNDAEDSLVSEIVKSEMFFRFLDLAIKHGTRKKDLVKEVCDKIEKNSAKMFHYFSLDKEHLTIYKQFKENDYEGPVLGSV